jgi:RNA polymerase sigma-70 factor (ECF subfamily)
VSDAPETRPSLLVRIRDPRDSTAWEQFANLYTPLITGFVRKRGLQPADADDLTQTILCDVSTAVRGLDYDPTRGTFRAWLFTIVRRHLSRFLARNRKVVIGSGDTEVRDMLEEHPDDAADEAEWEAEFRRQQFRWAAERVRGEFTATNWEAFWRTAVLGLPATDVARELETTVGAVYTAKCRILDRIRAEIRTLGEDD